MVGIYSIYNVDNNKPHIGIYEKFYKLMWAFDILWCLSMLFFVARSSFHILTHMFMEVDNFSTQDFYLFKKVLWKHVTYLLLETKIDRGYIFLLLLKKSTPIYRSKEIDYCDYKPYTDVCHVSRFNPLHSHWQLSFPNIF